MHGLEISEAMEAMERFNAAELQEQREALRLQADAAREAGNEEKANYFQGQMTKLEQQLAAMAETDGDASLGSKAGESMALRKADKEYAKNGDTVRYRQYLEEAAKEHRTPD